MAASFPPHYNDFDDHYHFFTDEFLGLPTNSDGSISGKSLNNDAAVNMMMMMPFMSSDTNSPVSVGSFPGQQFGVPADCMAAAPPLMSEWEMGFGNFSGYNSDNYNFNDADQVLFDHLPYQELIIRGLVVPPYNFCRPANYHRAADGDWGMQENQVAKIEEPELKVGRRYSVEERKDRILRYLKKRNQRNYNKTIKYACRKTLADKRVRVRGRFAKNNEPGGDENIMKTSDYSFGQDISFYDNNSFQMICNDDDWLETTAMAGLLYLPYL